MLAYDEHFSVATSIQVGCYCYHGTKLNTSTGHQAGASLCQAPQRCVFIPLKKVFQFHAT